MSEWAVVTVIVTLVGLVVAVVTPIVKLNSTITNISTRVGSVEKDIDTLTSRNTQNYDRILTSDREQDRQLAAHEIRLAAIERMKK